MKTKTLLALVLSSFFALFIISCMGNHESNKPGQPGRNPGDNSGDPGDETTPGNPGGPGGPSAGELYDLSVALQEEQDDTVTEEVVTDMYALAGKPFGTPCELFVPDEEKDKYEKTYVDIELAFCVSDYNAVILENGIFRTQAYEDSCDLSESCGMQGVGNDETCDDYGLRHKSKLALTYQGEANFDNQIWLHPQFVDFWLSRYKNEKAPLSTDCIYFKTAEFGIDQTGGESKEGALMGTEVKSNGKPWKTYVWQVNGNEGFLGIGADAASFKIGFKLEYFRLKEEYRNPPEEEPEEEY